MKQKVGLWQWFGFAVTVLLGTVLHFLYDWLGGAVWVAPFAAVNESTWEHMKLLFLPMLLFAFVQSFFFRDRKDFWCVKLRSILLGLSLIPVLFYTYNGAIGESPDAVNVTIFFVSAAIAYLYEAKCLRAEQKPCRAGWALAAILGIAALFVLFTFVTPKIGIFMDPVTGTFGI